MLRWRSHLMRGALSALLLALVALTVSAAAPAGFPALHLLTLETAGLEDLGPGWAYEGWLIVDGAPVSTGVFTVDSVGVPSQTHFPVTVNRSLTTAFVLTIEPSPDPDPNPSATHLLAGDFADAAAALAVAHPAALGDDFLSAAGSFILAVPSEPTAPYTQGIWWLDPVSGAAALQLPTLPAGWQYEGWVVGPDGPLSTGAFTDPAAADSDAGGPYAGPNPTPPFPGQDFVHPPLDLVGLTAVISVEPDPDNSPAPFALKPLVDAVIEDPGAPGLLQSMSNNAATFPIGSATLVRASQYEVVIEDLTGGQPLTPPLLAVHDRQTHLFTVGASASLGLQEIAENGNLAPMLTDLMGNPAVAAIVTAATPLAPEGTPGGALFDDSVTLTVIAPRSARYLSFVSMLICTNDGFTGVDGLRLPWRLNHPVVMETAGYDAGTEINTEDFADIVPACQELIGVTSDDPGTGVSNPALAEGGVVAHHAGVQGGVDLLPETHGWSDPVARITVTRVIP